jgi:hypothetical protein
MYGPKGKVVTRKQRAIHNDECHDLCSSKYLQGDSIKVKERGGAFSMHWGGKNKVVPVLN